MAMPELDEAYTRRRFVDFIDAIVIGAVFTSIAPVEISFRFFGILFLLIVILEDFYTAHTQLATLGTPQIALRFPPLVVELAISLFWYLSAVAFPERKSAFLVALGCFPTGNSKEITCASSPPLYASGCCLRPAISR
jgi:hypothetical protein